MKPNKFLIDEIIKNAIKEDINYLDVATDLVIDSKQRSTAVLISKAEGVVCGLEIAMRVFELLDDTFEAKAYFKDGDEVKNGDLIAEMSGKTALLLNGERTALNLLQHLSGVATITNKMVKLCEGTNASVTDTRKTLPGLRALQKYAVVMGGGKNHRFNLSDAAMLKDNHIDAAGSITNAVNKLRQKLGHTVKIEVETRTLEEVKEAVQMKADIIMLDNMDCDTMKTAAQFVAGRALLEASGNINQETISNVAKTGVDIISIGAITHSVNAFDISMRIK